MNPAVLLFAILFVFKHAGFKSNMLLYDDVSTRFKKGEHM